MRLRSKRGRKEKKSRRREEEKRGHAHWERKKEVLFAALRLWFCCFESVIAGTLEFVRCILLGKAFLCFCFSNLCQR
jgi:hypothetical protein